MSIDSIERQKNKNKNKVVAQVTQPPGVIHTIGLMALLLKPENRPMDCRPCCSCW
jgi:hypothetical protein